MEDEWPMIRVPAAMVEQLEAERDTYKKALTYISNIGSQFDEPNEPVDLASSLVRALKTAIKAPKETEDEKTRYSELAQARSSIAAVGRSDKRS